ncbi:MAG: restriction endonuclease [Coprobacillaceae bacterium]
MTKKKSNPIITICFLPFRIIYKLLLSICIIYSHLKNAIKKWIYRNNIDAMSGVEFEHFTKELLKQNGYYHVELTKASNDYGIDILAMRDKTLYAIQCKKYKNKVGIEAVRQAATGCTFYDQDIPVVFTNSTFSSQAIKLAETLDVELWDQEMLQQLMSKTKQIKRKKHLLLLLFLSILLLLVFLLK